LFAHAALSDPDRSRLLLAERSARTGFGLARAEQGTLDVAIDAWSLKQEGDASYRTRAQGEDFELDLIFERTQPPLLNGKSGFSQKSSKPSNASYYYSLPHLAVTGEILLGERRVSVRGEAWMDHEWSTEFLDPSAHGWDWIGINLENGGALMASRIRRADRSSLWSFASLRLRPEGHTEIFAPENIEWTPIRHWRSARTGVSYPVEWRVRVGTRTLRIVPSMDDQESDTRSSTGTIYWEGAVRALDETNRVIGRGYLELTGYGSRLKM
jgi:predicted secreted hydrolase